MSTLLEIRTANKNLRDEFASSASPHKDKINSILREFDGFVGDYTALWDDISKKVPLGSNPGTLISQVEARLSDLWSDLQKIVNQYRDGDNYNSAVHEGMNQLRELCVTNPKIFPPEQQLPDTLVFVKDDDTNLAKKYPFTNTFFIGISKACVDASDWKPLAHELGHYIYWNSQFEMQAGIKIAENAQEPVFAKTIKTAVGSVSWPKSTDETTIEMITTLIISWSEEIFADIVGTSLREREYVTSAQELFFRTQKDPEDTFRFIDDIEHPIPYLRPFICAEALKCVEEGRNLSWSSFSAKVAEVFGKKFEASQTLFLGLFSRNDLTETLDIPKLQTALKVVIPVIFETLQNREVLEEPAVGIDLIKERISEEFVGFYIDASAYVERGWDGPGLRRRTGDILRRIISALLKPKH